MDQSKIKNPNCESCGTNDWQTEEKGPAIIYLPQDGSFGLPPQHAKMTLLICKNCFFVRMYAEVASKSG